jgi:hypothetical protein
MTSDAHRRSSSDLNGDHEHEWHCLEDGESSGAWAFQCTICHRTRAGLRIGRSGQVESTGEAANSEQRASVDARERALDVRERRLTAREGRQLERRDEVEAVLRKAALRDAVSDARDVAADKRDMAANADAWLHDVQDPRGAHARQEASDDRLHSRSDREASAMDRTVLADNDS